MHNQIHLVLRLHSSNSNTTHYIFIANKTNFVFFLRISTSLSHGWFHSIMCPLAITSSLAYTYDTCDVLVTTYCAWYFQGIYLCIAVYFDGFNFGSVAFSSKEPKHNLTGWDSERNIPMVFYVYHVSMSACNPFFLHSSHLFLCVYDSNHLRIHTLNVIVCDH